MGIFVDPITIVMFAVVTSVALMVNIFSIGYMKGEPRYFWFFAVLQLFVAAMLLLVMADNLLLVYIAWELVGVCSFLLIGFYWEKRSATEAAKKAFITTRIGDVGLLIGIILLWKETGTFNIQEIIHIAEAGEIGQAYLFTAVAFIFLGCMGKSAQVPFHVWLPDAMEGPTPVSALIHAATMVVAGVYLTARLLPIFEVADGALLMVTIVGLTTALLTGFIALAQTDIKKVLAYSTVGQLGFMFVALGTGEPAIGMFHLMTHAFFKALLFLGSGSVIHATHHNQEMDKLGGLWRKMPITATTFFIGSLALAGLPPLAGFWSKDEIFVYVNKDTGSWAVVLLGIAAVLTAFYTTRLFVRTFMGEPKDPHVHEHTRESSFVMTGPLIFLAGL
ncbi:MAG TPA: NADH-quinone oxidoreductase subunit L, partial [Tepidiformaceae bacterium]|nr:NADH-quinone oxidoreductase subunit L [Tepidiformaceae bacterium]